MDIEKEIEKLENKIRNKTISSAEITVYLALLDEINIHFEDDEQN